MKNEKEQNAEKAKFKEKHGDKDSKQNNGETNTIIEEKVVKADGTIYIRKYLKGKYLGKGGFAKCFEITSTDNNKILAAKIISKAALVKSRAKQKLMSEIRIHRSVNHSRIVKLEHFFEDADNVYILLEMCHNQTLNELIRRRKKLLELEVQCYLVQLIEAVKYLHSHRIIHRDLKLGNLFITDKMEIKVGDFGLATRLDFEGERKRTICGTPNYIAPEILEGKQGHSYEVDIWSIGVIIYTLIIGKPPFETADVKTTYRKIKMNSYNFPDTVKISDECKNLIQSILNNDPSQRPKLSDIQNHPFLTKNPIPELLHTSTLACPPSISFLKQYMPFESTANLKTLVPQRLESTNTCDNLKAIPKENFLNTDRIGFNKQTLNLDKCEKIETGKDSQAKNILTEAGHLNNSKEKGKTDFTEKSKDYIYVKKWVDYSAKYGIGYLLSNNCTGVYFNDSTKVLLNNDGHQFSYYEKNPKDKNDDKKVFLLDNYPKELQKKVTLLQHFRSYLEGENSSLKDIKAGSAKTEIYLKKWLHTKHAMIFRLSNKIVQVQFEDKTEIILFSDAKLVTYVNKKGEREQYSLALALESTNKDLNKRLKYTKEILTQMVQGNNQQKNKAVKAE